jgi:FkbH-like protein/FkbM family methyltransferase
MQTPSIGTGNFSPRRSQSKRAEFKVGVRSVPYLVDHGFADMIVLSGSFYINMVLQVHREIFNEAARVLKNIRFQNPLILAEEDAVVGVESDKQNGKRTEYKLFGLVSEGGNATTDVLLAELEIDPSWQANEGASDEPWIEEFKASATLIADGNEFYKKLRQNGNQYGPRFQNVAEVWRSGDQVWGRVDYPVGAALKEAGDELDPLLLDSITQILGAFTFKNGCPYVLKSIERIEIREHDFPITLWARVTRRTRSNTDENELIGDIQVFDTSGKHYLELVGVTFAFLDRVTSAATERASELNLCIASTFTAEPIEDTLRYWGDQFGFSVHVHFAPYSQVFQQLLDAESLFRKNSDGISAILLNLEDWAEKDQPKRLKPDAAKAEKYFTGPARYVLPNELEIVHLNRYETDYLYAEIFRDECYLRHGVRLNDGDTVVDIGANIGMFSLFVLSRCQNAKVYAFEPSPVVYELLKANGEAYGSNVRCFQCGVSDHSKTAEFTFYENSSVFSSFHPDAGEDKKAIEAVVRNVLGAEAGEDSYESFVQELTAERLHQRTYQCRLVSVSDIIRENRIEKINLLKIDAEKSELEILAGIEEADWARIDQIVIEIHDRTKRAVAQVEQLLIDKGYRCAVEQERLLENSGLCNIYATRLETTAASAAAIGLQKTNSSLQRNIDEFSAALASFMSQSAVPMILCICPRSPETRANSKKALDAAEQSLLSRTKKIANLHAIASQTILKRYPLEDYYDPGGYQLGHVPYTPEGYVALGIMLFQTIFQLENKPLKVLAIDCDNTLWKGVCGEDGAAGIQINETHRTLQEFALEQMRAGMLICLCSKNNEKDVFDVFDQRREMVLKREHLAAWQINWNRKSESLKALAEELNVGLDSFLFLDDNAVECADVRISCPEVIALQLPRESETLPSFLSGIWGLSQTSLTKEDQKRTEMYQENLQRDQFREHTVSLKDFLGALQLRIQVTVPTEDQIARVSQLTFRTNQFNFTTIRRTENEITSWLEKENRECLVASVSDRFGDYGLVGVLLYEMIDDQLHVDTFLLSCRVLGRGVEHYLLAELARKAQEKGKKLVTLRYERTEKNSPALQFIRSLGAADIETKDGGGLSVKVRAETLANLRYDPDKASQSQRTKRVERVSVPKAGGRFGTFNRSERIQKIAEELSDINRIAKAIDAHRYGDKSAEVSDEAGPADTLERVISNIWKKVLARRQIGMNDNFFEVGGTSLKAVQLIAMLQKELKRTLSITTLFECPTINLLSAKLKGSTKDSSNGIDSMKARERGQKRRQIRPTKKTVVR